MSDTDPMDYVRTSWTWLWEELARRLGPTVAAEVRAEYAKRLSEDQRMSVIKTTLVRYRRWGREHDRQWLLDRGFEAAVQAANQMRADAQASAKSVVHAEESKEG